MSMTEIQRHRLTVWRENGESFSQTAKLLGINRSTLTESVKKALEWEMASEGELKALANTGIDIGSAKHGWRVIVQPDGSRDSVFWSKQKASIKSEDLATAIVEALQNIPVYPEIPTPLNQPEDLCNFLPLADLHVGAEYGDPEYLPVVMETLDSLISALPSAQKAVLLDMGDLLDANDHKGLTPASENNCDVIRENHLKNTIDALSIMLYATKRLAETHEEVEVHLLRGNHDETAYIGVMVALSVHFRDNPRINIVLSDDDFRVISWGKCAVFPHHGDKTRWEDLMNIFSDQFPDAWAAAKYWRFIWTAHVHHDKQRQLIGADAEHFRTLAKPNRWAKLKGFFSRGGIQAITLHKEDGEIGRTKRNLKPLLLQDSPKKKFL